jgi:hypothetical protein
LEEPFLSGIECIWAHDVKQKEIHTAEPLVPHPSVFEREMANEELKKDKGQQILIKFQQNLPKQEAEQFILRSINFENN